jgi:AraC-like DNA-binding protein
MFAAKYQVTGPPELIEPTDPRVCVRTSHHRRRVSRRSVVEGNPERLAWVESSFNARGSTREGLVTETKRWSVKTAITTARTKTAGKLTISEAAFHVGFVDQSHLARHFKRVFGLPPKRLLGRRRPQILV